MNSIPGFGRSEERESSARPTDVPRTSAPRRSLALIRFPEIQRAYSYYNDRFDLQPGDVVFVTGRLAGTQGVVESVNYKFKINLADYEKVVGAATVELHGEYQQVADKMLSYDVGAVSPDEFRSWVKAPVTEDDEEKPEFVQGEGYRFELEHFADDDEVDPVILRRAVDYCNDGLVRYLSVRNGIGTAFVEGSKWYEVNFRYQDGVVSDLYCECPYHALCKHNLAVLITLRGLLKKTETAEFTTIDKGCFMRLLSLSGQPIMLG